MAKWKQGIRAIFKYLVLPGVVLVGLLYVALLYQNNAGGDALVETREAQLDLAQSIDSSFERALEWVYSNEEKIMRDHNPTLWWMLRQVAEATSDRRLKDMIWNYGQTNYTLYALSPWAYMIYGSRPSSTAVDLLGSNLVYYNLHLYYGYSCDAEMAGADIIRRQNETGFCLKHYPFSPACTTHQLMAFRFMQRTGCDAVEDLDTKVQVLLSRIRRQLVMDPRLVDVYLQRVLMLVDSDAADRVNPRWVQRIMEAQKEDGSWSDNELLLKLSGNRYLAFTARGIGFSGTHASFHATVQGLWLMYLLQEEKYALR